MLVDWKKLKYNILCGIVAVAMQLAVDTNAIAHGYYAINRPGVSFLGSSLFFVLGPVVAMGVLMSQYHPGKKSWRLLHVVFFAAMYSLQEFLLLKTGALEYLQWHYLDSLVVNIGAMIVISWFANVVLEEKGTNWK